MHIPDITANDSGLLPRFLTLALSGGCFLLHLSRPRGHLPVKKGGCSVLPGLSSPLMPKQQRQRQAGLLNKDFERETGLEPATCSLGSYRSTD